MKKLYYVYLLTNHPRHTVLYTGITGNLLNRCQQHKQKMVDGFTKRYNADKLVYYEEYDNVYDAIRREKQIKGWTRKKKEALIDKVNSEWQDLFDEFV